MGSVAPDKWTAEVPVDEPLRTSIPGWSIGRIADSADVDAFRLCCLPFSQMATWLHQRSVGAWQFVRRERIAGRVSLRYRAFQFEQLADACFFASAWSAEILRLRVFSVEHQIAETGFLSGFETAQEREVRVHESRPSRGRLDDMIVWLVDVWPLRRRARFLERLRHRPTHRQLQELVATGHRGDR